MMKPRHHVLVTGASRGIGRAIAEQCAVRGCRVVVHYQKNRAAAEQVLAALPGTGHAILAADMGNTRDVDRLWREALAAFGHIDLLVNNAGTFGDHAPLTTNFAEWERAWQHTLATNLVGPAHLSYLAARAMAATGEMFDAAYGRGRIVNISSRGAFRGEPRAPAYGASKAGLNSLSQSLALALAPQGVYVYCIAPGWVDTDMAGEYLTGPRAAEIRAQHPLGRVATAEEIARTAVFCGLDAPATMTGSIIDVNGASYLRT